MVASLFVLALGVAVAVIIAEVAPQVDRIRAVLAGTRHDVATPLPIAIQTRRRRITPRPRLSPSGAAARAAAA